MKIIDSLFSFIADFMDKYRVREVTVTATTSAAGAIQLSSIPNTATILTIISPNTAYIVIPWVYVSQGGTLNWYAKVLNWSTMAAISNTNITVRVRYILGGV